jgi:hypothetical protein
MLHGPLNVKLEFMSSHFSCQLLETRSVDQAPSSSSNCVTFPHRHTPSLPANRLAVLLTQMSVVIAI